MEKKRWKTLIGKDENRAMHSLIKTGYANQLLFFAHRGLGLISGLNSKRENLLLTAIKSKQKEGIDISLKFGNHPGQYGVYKTFRFNALSLLVYTGYIEGLDQLVKTLKELRQLHKLDFHQMTSQLGSLLHVAIWAGQSTMLQHLLQVYYEQTYPLLDVENHEGKTPLILAASTGDIYSLKILLSKGADIEKRDFLGQTAMHHAVKNGQVRIIAFLCHAGAKLNTCDHQGQNPRAYSNDKFIKNLLINHYEFFLKGSTNKFIDYLDQKPFHAIFQGGGAKGVVYIGVTKAMEELGLFEEMRRFAGTSAGALLALFLAIGFNTQMLEETLKNILTNEALKRLLGLITFDLEEEDKKNLDNFTASIKKNILGIKKVGIGLLKLFAILAGQRTGWADGVELKNWLNEIIILQTGIVNCTFGEFADLVEKGEINKKSERPFKHLHVLTTDLNTSSLLQLNSEQKKWENFLIADAVVASSAFPLLIALQKMREKVNGKLIVNPKYQCTDGGILANLPDEIFDRVEKSGWLDSETAVPQFNRRTIAFCFEQSPIPPTTDTSSAYTFLLRVLKRVYRKPERLRKQIMPNRYETRLVRISNGKIHTTEFNAPQEKIQAAIDAAYTSTKVFFEEREAYLGDI